MKLSRDELDAEVKLHLYVRSYCLILRRREAGLSQDELADRAGLARGSVQHAEHARTGMNAFSMGWTCANRSSTGRSCA